MTTFTVYPEAWVCSRMRWTNPDDSNCRVWRSCSTLDEHEACISGRPKSACSDIKTSRVLSSFVLSQNWLRKKLSRFYCQSPKTPKFVKPKSQDYRIWKAMLEAYYKRLPKRNTIIDRTQENAADLMIWDSLHQRSIDKAVKEFPKWLKTWDGHCTFAVNGEFWCSVAWRYFTVFAQTFSNALKSLGGNVAVLIILTVYDDKTLLIPLCTYTMTK